MEEQEKGRAFIGQGWSFPPQFNRSTKGIDLVSDEQDIRESLYILFSTSPGERIMNPDYGCSLKALVFELIDEGTQAEIKDAIETAVLFYEPRITLEQVDVDINRALDGVISIHLSYLIRTTNTRSNMVYPFYYLEGTSVSL